MRKGRSFIWAISSALAFTGCCNKEVIKRYSYQNEPDPKIMISITDYARSRELLYRNRGDPIPAVIIKDINKDGIIDDVSIYRARRGHIYKTISKEDWQKVYTEACLRRGISFTK